MKTMKRFLFALLAWLAISPAFAATTIDTFGGTAGTDLASHTPNSGGPWSFVGGTLGSLALSGSNTLNLAGGSSGTLYSVPVGANNMYAAETLGANFQGSQRFWLCVRVIDIDNFYYLTRNGTTTWILAKRVSGASTTINTFTTATTGVGDVVRLEVSGSSLTMYLNGVSQGSASDGTFASGSAAGLRTGTSSLFADQISRFESGALTSVAIQHNLMTLGVGN